MDFKKGDKLICIKGLEYHLYEGQTYTFKSYKKVKKPTKKTALFGEEREIYIEENDLSWRENRFSIAEGLKDE